MSNNVHVKEVRNQEKQQFHRRQRGPVENAESNNNSLTPLQINVGRKLRDLRAEKRLSIRSLAELSGLNVNTLSLIENGKSSPSVSTLQQLAGALAVPITAFFEKEILQNDISYQKKDQRKQAAFAHGTLADLGAGLTLRGGQPFLVTLDPKADSGSTPIVHTGYEFVFCLEGCLSYTIEGRIYILEPGDSLLFEAHLSHCWQNISEFTSKSLLIMCPTDESDHPTERHFKPQ
jgi:transcriptional regulator with XRE-family HTH domain